MLDRTRFTSFIASCQNWWYHYGNGITLLLKAGVLIAVSWYLYHVLLESQGFDRLIRQLFRLQASYLMVLPVVSGLMVANWGIEALKWRYLLKPIQSITLGVAFKAVLSGVSISALLPNRVAEYLGRIFYIPGEYRIKAILVTLVGSLAQLLVSIVAGSLALVIYFYYPFDGTPVNLYLVAMLILLLNSLLLAGYFNMPFLVAAIPRDGRFRKAAQYLTLIGTYHQGKLGKVLMWASLRYGVFLLQFYLLLYAFQVPLSPFQGLITLPVVFLAQTLIPTIALVELGIRGATAIHFIGALGGDEINILAATYALWLINILLPACLGAVFMAVSKGENRINHYG